MMSAEDKFEVFKTSIVRIYASNTVSVGLGTLISTRYIVTCAHVVAQALCISQNSPQAPTLPILLDFPLSQSRQKSQKLIANVIFWQPVQPLFEQQSSDIEDIAILELEHNPPNDCCPIKLLDSTRLWGHSFRAFGYPQGHEQQGGGGVWTCGELREDRGNGWIQLEDTKVAGYKIEPGFSGTPIWDETLQRVVGIAVAAEIHREYAKAAFMIPNSTLRTVLNRFESTLLDKQVINTFNKEGTIASLKRVVVNKDPTIIGAIDLVSASAQKGLTSTLRESLETKRWKDADYITYLLMLESFNHKEGEWLIEQELKNFPCDTLRVIDKLWSHYSEGHLGLSRQKEIWESRKIQTNHMRFAETVGWLKNGKWLHSSDLESTFLERVPDGCLPAFININACEELGYKLELQWTRFLKSSFPILISRLELCGF